MFIVKLIVVVAVLAAIAFVTALIVHNADSKQATELVAIRAGHEKYRVEGRMQIGHMKCRDGHAAFCDDGVIVAAGHDVTFVPYGTVRAVTMRPSSIRFVADGFGPVIVNVTEKLSQVKQDALRAELEGVPA